MTHVPCVVVGGNSAESRGAVASMLTAEPWHIVGVPDGDAVCELAASHAADIVLMECRQPGFDGYEVTRRLRREGDSRLLPIVLMSGINDIGSRVAALEAGADDFLSIPLERTELVARVRSLLAMKSMRDRLEDVRQVIFTLARAAEAKDVFTLMHAERVADNASELARRVLLSPDVVQQIRAGALIHDVGKIAVPDHVLSKPGPLTPDEFEVVKRHTLVGAEIVAPLATQRHLVGIVRSHHERFDGAGYPDSLAGKDIPLAARIVAVCDAYDAMVNQRPYRAAMAHGAAIATLVDGRARQWDAELVDAFVAIQEHR
jgi:putative two-component system response regulator